MKFELLEDPAGRPYKGQVIGVDGRKKVWLSKDPEAPAQEARTIEVGQECFFNYNPYGTRYYRPVLVRVRRTK